MATIKTESKADIPTEADAPPEAAVKTEDQERDKPAGPSAERQSSERPVSEPGVSKKEEAEEEKAAAAAAAKEQQLLRAETIL